MSIAYEEKHRKVKLVDLHTKKNIENASAFSFAQPSFLSWKNLIMSFCSCCQLFTRGKSYVSGHIISPASFTSTSRAFRDVIGPTAQYRSTNFKYLPKSMASCTLTNSEIHWNFPTWDEAMLQLTGQSACCCSRRKPSGESSCSVQIPWNTSPRVESLSNDRTPQLRITFTPLHTWTDTSIARRAQTNSDHCISDFATTGKLFHVCVDHEGILGPRPIALFPSSPDLCTRSQPQINLHAKSTHTLTRNRKLTLWTCTRNRPARWPETEN